MISLTTEWDSRPLVGIVHGDTSPTMLPKVRDLFVAGLRSGRYPQGFDRLRSADETFTALGVLCDIATKVKEVAWDKIDGEWFIAPLNPPATGAFLPRPVRDWAGITGTHPSQELPLEWGGYMHPIWRLSDIFKMPFDVLADLVRLQY
jgi:hypothetical protein